MGRILYLDCFSGISGNMFLGALLDLGLDFEALSHELTRLGIEGYRLERRRVDRCGISSTHFDVILSSHQH
ncbi:MAG: nickel insertion protein, partial [Blastocatellia bacterium]